MQSVPIAKVIAQNGVPKGKKFKIKNMHPLMHEKDLEGRTQLHCDLECMGCTGLVSSPWNIFGSNWIIMKIAREVEVEEEWKKTPQAEPTEWT